MPIELALLFIVLAFVLGYMLGLTVAKGILRKAQYEADQELARTLEEVEKVRLQ